MPTYHDIGAARAARSRALLESMPDALYRSLSSPSVTADVCSEVVARALRSRNAGLVREWIRYESEPIEPDTALACLDLAVTAELRDITDDRTIAYSRTIRNEALAQIGSSPRTNRESKDQSNGDLIAGMLLAIRTTSNALAEHSLSVGRLSVNLGRAAGLSADGLLIVEQAAHIHELGRARLPESVVGSPNRFGAKQLADVRTTLGDVSALEQRPALRAVADTVYGIYCADVFTVTPEIHVVRTADAFISLCEKRPFRPAFAPREALNQLWKTRGERLDVSYLEKLAQILGYEPRYARTA